MTEPVLTPAQHSQMANAIRALSMDAVQQANSGHPGMPMGMADVATVLFTRFLKFDPAAPDWADRDRFVLSAGHGSMLLYSLLHLTGYADMTIEELKNFRQLGAKTAGHPEFGHAAGIETTTGPLGQGLGNAVGMALAERLLNARFGDELIDHHTYVVAGDGCLMEGISHEAASLAGHLKLGKLIVLFDDNGISIDGGTELAVSDDQTARFAAHGWHTDAVDGHDPDAVAAAIERAQRTAQPTLIACRTTIGYGAPTKAGTAATHGSPLGDEEITGAREQLGWPHAPFEVPADIRELWLAAGRRGAEPHAAWRARRDADVQGAELARRMSGALPDDWQAKLDAYIETLIAEQPKLATRQASGKTLDVLAEAIPELLGGSADLTGSNLTKTGAQKPVGPGDYAGSYVYYGVREHGMAAAMNGLALHGGVVPYGGTFLVFTDYCRPAIRLSALMGQRVIYVMTHDSIGLGEDGPTHQPVEHLSALRAIPNLNVYRPADAVETAECWGLALASTNAPSILALTRQGLPALRTEPAAENLCGRGAYRLAPAQGNPQASIWATGSEVEIALGARELLAADGIDAEVISAPCLELFEAQPQGYRDELLGGATVKVAVEAALRHGWDRYIGPDGVFVGMTGFGASAPAGELYEHFGITAQAIAAAVKERI